MTDKAKTKALEEARSRVAKLNGHVSAARKSLEASQAAKAALMLKLTELDPTKAAEIETVARELRQVGDQCDIHAAVLKGATDRLEPAKKERDALEVEERGALAKDLRAATVEAEDRARAVVMKACEDLSAAARRVASVAQQESINGRALARAKGRDGGRVDSQWANLANLSEPALLRAAAAALEHESWCASVARDRPNRNRKAA